MPAYVKQTWANGVIGATPLSAARLNHIEDGIEEASLSILNVKNFGAQGNNETDDTASIQNAIDTIYAAGGGLLYFPAGIYRCFSGITYRSKITYQGSHQAASVLFWPSDLGADTFGMEYALPPEANELSPRFNGLSFIGPSPAIVYGTQGVDMDGMRLLPHGVMSDCRTQGFRSGIVISGDHQELHAIKSTSNYIGVRFEQTSGDWATGSLTSGDQLIVGGEYTFNALAAFTCDVGNIINGVGLYRPHIGFTPYGFYRDDSAHTTYFLSGCVLSKPTLEDIGNAAISDNSSNTAQATLSNVTIERPVVSSSFAADHRIAADSHANYFDFCSFYNSKIVMGYPASLPTGATRWIKIKGSINDSSELIDFPIAATADSFYTGGGVPGSTVRSGSTIATMEYAGGTITRGDLVAQTTSGMLRLTAATVDSFAGVALQNAVNTNYIPIASSGLVFINAEAVTAGQALRAFVGTEHHASSAGANPIIAIARQNGGGGGGTLVQAQLR